VVEEKKVSGKGNSAEKRNRVRRQPAQKSERRGEREVPGASRQANVAKLEEVGGGAGKTGERASRRKGEKELCPREVGLLAGSARSEKPR